MILLLLYLSCMFQTLHILTIGDILVSLRYRCYTCSFSCILKSTHSPLSLPLSLSPSLPQSV